MERRRQWENEGRIALWNAARGAGEHVENSPLWVFLFQHLCICSVAFLQVLTTPVIKVSISNEQGFMNRDDLPTPPRRKCPSSPPQVPLDRASRDEQSRCCLDLDSIRVWGDVLLAAHSKQTSNFLLGSTTQI